MSKTVTLITSRHPKGLQFIQKVEAVYNKAGLNEERAQRLNESPEFVQRLRELIQQCSATNQFANEEVKSRYGYLSGYTKPKPLAKQVTLLRQLFPELVSATLDGSLEGVELPAGAEGCFAIPNWQLLAPTYGEAVRKVLDLIKQNRDGKFYNYIEGELGPQQLQQCIKTVEAFQALGEVQKGHDILVVPAQFGIRHSGRSVRRAREVMSAGEFGLGAFAVGIMILTHPNRLEHHDDLWPDCPGDERDPDAVGSFDNAPIFVFDDGGVGFHDGYVGRAVERCGSVSGFLSK